MRPTFPWHTNKAQLSMTTSSLDHLEQMAKARGAAAGLHGVDDDFAASVDATLHFMFIAQYRALGPEPDALFKQQEACKADLEHTYKKLQEHQKSRLDATDHSKGIPHINYRFYPSVVACCGLVGLGCEVAGVQMLWRGWAILGALAVLLILLVQTLPCWARNMKYYIDRRALLRRAKRLERTILRLGETAWKETELRSHRDQFIIPRRQLLVGIFEYYKAAGQCTANHKHVHRLAAA
jgi:hypothetical protein